MSYVTGEEENLLCNFVMFIDLSLYTISFLCTFFVMSITLTYILLLLLSLCAMCEINLNGEKMFFEANDARFFSVDF